MQSAPLYGDLEIRGGLLTQLRDKHGTDTDAVVVQELGMCRGQVRVDVALVNGAFHGYEIKSDRDSLRRLDRQAEVYGQVLDRATLVTGERHLEHVLATLPSWWGIVIAGASQSHPRSEAPTLTTIRAESPNPDRKARALAELLWLQDALQLLDDRQALRGYRSKPCRIVWDRLCEVYSLDEIAAAVRERLKARARRGAAQPSK
jgi:hypothetical protein